VPADQAAGLRRRNASQLQRCIHVLSDSAASTPRLAHALHQRGWTVLLVDASGRLLADASPRALFDWRQQLARGQAQTLPMPYGDAWHAPGVQADEPALTALARRYDCLLFDARPDAADWMPRPDSAHTLVLDMRPEAAAVQRGYAWLKTVSSLGGRVSVGLLGDADACDRLQAACTRFLDPAFAGGVFSVAHEVDAFAALAVRMAVEETHLMARSATENIGNMALKHGG